MTFSVWALRSITSSNSLLKYSSSIAEDLHCAGPHSQPTAQWWSQLSLCVWHHSPPLKHPGSGQRLFHTSFIQLRVKFIMSIMNDSNHHSNIKLVSEFFVVEGLVDDDTNNIIVSSLQETKRTHVVRSHDKWQDSIIITDIIKQCTLHGKDQFFVWWCMNYTEQMEIKIIHSYTNLTENQQVACD